MLYYIIIDISIYIHREIVVIVLLVYDISKIKFCIEKEKKTVCNKTIN